MNSIVAAQSGHTFLYRGWEVTSEGNAYAHAILRGYVDYAGKSVSNYHYEDLLRVKELYDRSSLLTPSVIVDTNHNNSGKKYLEQVRIAKDVVHSRNQNDDIKKLVKGLMIESYLEDGAQSTSEHVIFTDVKMSGGDKSSQVEYTEPSIGLFRFIRYGPKQRLFGSYPSACTAKSPIISRSSKAAEE